MCRKNEQPTTSKGETWSRGTNSRLPFDVNVMLNLSINAQICSQIQRVKKKQHANLKLR